MTRGLAVRVCLATLAVGVGTTSASAQVFGTFIWQMQPYCNRVTLTLTSVTGQFRLDGSDDQCGAAQKGGASGAATFNPDGSVGLSITIVAAPAGRAVHVAARVNPTNGQGTWTDDAGHGGTWAFFGSAPGLPARPGPDVHFRTAGTNLQVLGLNAPLAVTSWTSAEVDNVGGGVFDPGAGSYTIPAAGVYTLATTLRLATMPTGSFCGHLFVNGVQRVVECQQIPTAILGMVSLSGTMRLAAGDVVSVRATNATGAAGGINASADNTFSVTRVH